MSGKFYVTTAIDYTNDVVHIGHSYQKILADALARYHRLIGDNTHFLTGTDEHGQKVAKGAAEAGVEPKKWVDEVAQKDKAEWKALNIAYDRFIRTTDEDHVRFAQEVYLKAKEAGDIYLGKFEGLYCEGCEGYLEESELVDGKCPFHPNTTPTKVTEENYFFRLSKYQKFLEELLAEGTDFVVPDGKRKEILAFIKRGLKDFSISRPNVKWGIPVPDDSGHTIYVWFDALINYLTYGVEEKCWPADLHVLGKDNAKFHAIYWPAMLKSTGYELPKRILVHDYVALNGQKISKSLGNVIRPTELTGKYGADGVRYFFLRFGPLTNDVDFTLEKFTEAYNAALANGLGNVVARVAKLCETSGENFPESKSEFFGEVKKYLEAYQVNAAVDWLWGKLTEIDQFIEEKKPWTLSGGELKEVLNKLVPEVRQIAFNLQPFLPETAEKILAQYAGPKIKGGVILFPRIK